MTTAAASTIPRASAPMAVEAALDGTFTTPAGLYYKDLGTHRVWVGTGAPTHAATVGDQYIDQTSGIHYSCTVATGTWTAFNNA